MITYRQLIISPRVIKKKKIRTPALKGNPHLKGTCTKVTVTTPKKPNSALRKIARVLLSTKGFATCYIPGIGHNLQKFSCVLVRGGRVKDVPGMRYKIVRGKFDTKPVYRRKQARSKYGVKTLKF